MLLKTFLALLTCIVASSAFADETATLRKLPDAQRSAFKAMFDWQLSMQGTTEQELYSRFGTPDEYVDPPANPTTQKPVRTAIYRLTRFSTLRCSLSEGIVTSVAVVTVPLVGEFISVPLK